MHFIYCFITDVIVRIECISFIIFFIIIISQLMPKTVGFSIPFVYYYCCTSDWILINEKWIHSSCLKREKPESLLKNSFFTSSYFFYPFFDIPELLQMPFFYSFFSFPRQFVSIFCVHLDAFHTQITSQLAPYHKQIIN